MQTLLFPLHQHIGAPSVAVVRAGESVRRGQLIAERAQDGALSSVLHASVNGVVVSVTEQGIEIMPDVWGAESDYVPLRGNTPLELIRESGLVGLGGAGFPTDVKLGKPLQSESQQSCGAVIVNAAECEPILSHNIARIEKNAAQVVRGLRIAMDIVKAERGILAIKEKNTAARNALQSCIDPSCMELRLLSDRYPMGEERAIIRETLGVLLDAGNLPSAASCVVLNAETVYRIYEAVEYKKPLIDKDITVAGKIGGEPVQVLPDVPIGTRVGEMIPNAGEYGELILGGPFTGKRTNPDAPITKTAGGILLAECFPKGPQKIGLLVCACGADETRLRELATSLGSEVVGVQVCKQAVSVKGAYKCANPGICPGQAEKILALKKAGAQAVLIGNCSDCTNTVMSCAPKMKLPVYHCTDGALRAVNHRLIRKLKK